MTRSATEPHPMMATLARLPLHVAMYLAVFLMWGCASLPDVRQLPTRAETRSAPTVENSEGNVSAQQAKSIVQRRVRGTRTDVARLAAMEEAATGSPLIAGNRTSLLFDGPQAMTAMLGAIRAAQDNINLETYIFFEDEIGTQFADLLIEKQRAGVQVNILYDSIGSLETPIAFFNRMRAAGIKVIEFNPINPLKRIGSWRLNNRDHRKLLVVDGKIAFTGGMNITEDYSRSSLFGSGRSGRSGGSGGSGGSAGPSGSASFGISGNRAGGELGWRDTHIQVEGPAVASLQLQFLESWAGQQDGDIPDREYFPPLPEVGSQLVRVLGSKPNTDFPIYKAYVLAIQEAKRSINLTAAYFAPDVQMLEAITSAARRGVDVKILFPRVSDNGLVFQAGRSFYTELLDAGVKIYQLKESVLHAKTAVIDSSWSTVGSSNLDLRSFLHNSELNLVILGTDFGAIMEKAFAEDLKNSEQMTKEAWAARPLADQVKEWAARNFEYWL